MLEWRRWINQVINDADLEMVYQPIVSLLSDATVGYEALARFPSIEGELFPPDEWFKHAHLLGLGEELEIVAVTCALTALPKIDPERYLSINASPSTILLEPFVLTVLGRFPERIVVELTEHDVVASYDTLLRQLDRMRTNGTRRGVRLGIDDVGAGVSNMVHIWRLHPDAFKLDRVLVEGIDKDRVLQEAVRMFATFGRNLGITVIAEGIETALERATLMSCGVLFGQGYLLGRPGPLGE